MNIFSGLKSWLSNWKEKEAIYGNSFFGFGQHVSVKQIYSANQDNKLLIDYFNHVAEVAAPILKYSDGAKQIKFVSNIPEVQNLLEKPNQYQGGDEWFSLTILYKRLFGESIINALSTIVAGEEKKRPTKLFLFTPELTKIKTSNQDDFRLKKIEKYLFPKNETESITVEAEQILHLKESNPNFKNEQYLFGESRYAGCASVIQSIVSGYDAKVNLYEDGPSLIITGKGQGDFGQANAGDDIKNVQDRMKKYNRKKGGYKNMITDVPLDVFKASMNVKDLQINENNQSDFRRLCDAQGIDVKVFSEASKFNDKKLALSDFYNNSFRSEIDGITRDLEKFLRQWWPKLELSPDYSEITEIVEAQNEENSRLFEDVKIGLITRNKYLEMTNQELSQEPTFDQLYILNSNNEWRPLNEIDQGTNQ